MGNWTNEDGLQVHFGEQGTARVGTDMAVRSRMVADLRWDDLPDFKADLDNDGTNDGYSGEDASIPAGSYIVDAYIVVETAFAGGTSINVGFYQEDGTVIDADGVDAAVTTAALGANKAVACDGALVGGTATVGANDAYLRVVPTGTFTAGKAKLFIEYIKD